MERLGKAGVVRRLVTIRTGRCTTGKLRQVRRGLQIRDRAGMTYGTGTAVDTGYDLARMTACTLAAHGDRSIRQAARRVRRMVVVTVRGQFLIRMTIQTMSGIGTQGYCINNLLSWAVVTGRTGTVPVGGYIMLGSLYLRPVSHNMTVAAWLAI